jgi:hypothetical protein
MARLAAAALERFEASSFWPVATWLPTRTAEAWWTTIAVLESLTFAARVSVLAAGLVAVQVLGRYSRRLKGLVRA